MEKIIEITQFGIRIELGKENSEDHWGGTITSNLKETCQDDDPDEIAGYDRYNDMMDALESIILAHACAGINVGTPLYIEGIQTACDACAKGTE